MAHNAVQEEMISLPPHVQRAMFLAALVKAGVAGAGVGLAALGAADFAFAATAWEWLDSMKPQMLINFFAIGGGVVGVTMKVIGTIWN
jgi:hypothetical protein